jgi:hypothetical protein
MLGHAGERHRHLVPAKVGAPRAVPSVTVARPAITTLSKTKTIVCAGLLAFDRRFVVVQR